MIKDLEVTEQVVFTGYVDPIPYYQNATLMIMTSMYEGFPMSISEAHSFKIPVVMMSLKFLENAKEGCIQVDKNDVDGLAEAAIKLLQNDTLRKELGN